MARDQAETAAQVDAAKKSVRFDIHDLSYHQPKSDKVGDTKLRRRSLDASQLRGHDIPETATLGGNDEEGHPPAIDYLASQFDTNCGPEVLFKFDELTADYHNAVDLPERLSSLAEYYGRKGTSPGFPFFPMTAAGKESWPRFDGIMDYDTFVAKYAEDSEALFEEMKLRALIMTAREQQMNDMYRLAQTAKNERDTLYGWCKELSTALHTAAATRANIDPARLEAGLDAATVRMTEMQDEIAARDEKITQLQEHATELSMALTRARESTPGSTRHSVRSGLTDRSAGGTPRTTKTPDPPVFYNDKSEDKVVFKVWLRHVRNKLKVNADHYPAEEAKMAFIESRLGGKVAEALEPYIDDDNPHRLDTSDKLLAHLQTKYSNKNEREDAIAAYKKLEMKAGDDFDVFKNEFMRLAAEAGKNPAEWKDDFNRLLTPGLETALAEKYLDDSVDFDAFVAHGSKIAYIQKKAYERREAKKKAAAPVKAPTAATAPAKRFVPKAGGTPSSPAGAAARNPRQKLAPDVLRKLILENRCFNCQQTGHASRDCPAKASVTSIDEANIQAIMDAYYNGKPPAPAKAVDTPSPSSEKSIRFESDSEGELSDGEQGN